MVSGFPGQVTGNSDAFSTKSLVLEKSSAPFGTVLVFSGDGLCRLPDKLDVLTQGVTTGKAAGILVKHTGDGMPCSAALATPIGNGETVYAKAGETVSLLRVGSIFVKSETDAVEGDQVFFRIKDGLLGGIRNDNDSGAAVKLNGAVYGTRTTAGSNVQIDCNLNTAQEAY